MSQHAASQEKRTEQGSVVAPVGPRCSRPALRWQAVPLGRPARGGLCGTILALALFLSATAVAAVSSQSEAATAPQGEQNQRRGENEMVLIHGLGSCAAVWDKVLPYLRGTQRVWVYEMPGHGHTPPIPQPTIEKVAADLARFIQEQGVVYPVLVGHGMGGLVAMRYTFDHPADVRRLIVIDAAPKQLATAEQKVQIADQLLHHYDHFVASRFLAMSPDSTVTSVIVDQALRTEKATFISLLMSSFDFDLTPELPRQAVPILVIGSHTFFPDPEQAVQHLDEIGYAGARSVSFKHFPYTGHFIMLEQPVYLASVILAFSITPELH